MATEQLGSNSKTSNRTGERKTDLALTGHGRVKVTPLAVRSQREFAAHSDSRPCDSLPGNLAHLGLSLGVPAPVRC